MADKNITVVLKAKDQASAAVRNLRGEFTKMSKSGGLTKAFMGGVGLSAGLGAMSAITTGIGIVTDAVSGIATGLIAAARAAREEDAEIARLSNTLDNNVHGWRMQSEALDAAIKGGQELAFTDSEMRDSIGKLSLSTGSLTETFRLLSGAQNIARDRNISLGDATNAVMKANQGQFKALKALGFQIEKGADKAKVLRDVFKRTEGAARLFANTTEGRLNVSLNRLGDAFEDLGREIPQVMDDWTRMRVDMATGGVEVITDLARQFNILTGNVKGVGQNAFILNAAWMGVTTSTREMQQALEDASAEGLQKAEQDARDLATALGVVVAKTGDTEKAWKKLLKPGDENRKSIKDLTHDVQMWRRRERQALEDGDQQRWAVARNNRTRAEEELKQHNTVARKFREEKRLVRETGARHKEAADKAAAAHQLVIDKLAREAMKIAAIREGIKLANALPDAYWTVHLGIRLPNVGIFNPLVKFLTRKGRASGGPVEAGQSYMVGERGPEMFTPRQSGNITPNGKSAGCSHPVYIDGELMTSWVMRKLGQQAMWSAG